jgi:hypothetical protein
MTTVEVHMTSDCDYMKYIEPYRFPLDFPVRVPVLPHPGAYGAFRKHDRHTGVDLYIPEHRAYTNVYAIEEGVVVAIVNFTGPSSTPPTPWRHDTEAVLVKGDTGVFLYGEIKADVAVGDLVPAGKRLGVTTPVLKKDKGCPMEMLHIELLPHDATAEAPTWNNSVHLLHSPPFHYDPTPILIQGLSKLMSE